jgi:hypothetical protein
MSTLDADALATLTPEEREAIESNDMTPEELAAMQRIAGDDDDDDDDDDDGASSEAAPVEGKGAAAEAAEAPQATDAPSAQADAADATAPAPARQSTTRYEAPLPADYDTKVQELAEREAELKRKFRSGEMEFDDFETQRAELLTERESLTIARTKAEISQEMTAQSAQQAWQNTVESFMDKAAKDGTIDYRKDGEKLEDLDQFVKTLAAKATNADKPMEWFLQEAHRRVQALHGMTTPAPTAAPAPAAAANAKPAATRRTPPVDAVPPTLANVPGGDGPGDVDGEFSDVLSLDGMEYETAIARMSAAQRERFLRAA